MKPLPAAKAVDCRRFSIALLALVGLCGIATARAGGAAAKQLRLEQRLELDHRALELYLSGLRASGDRVELGFSLRLKPGAASVAVVLGYPVYRVGASTWIDAVTLGVSGRNRTLRAVDVRDGGRVPFAVAVPRRATTLRLPLGDAELAIQLGPWFDRLDRGDVVSGSKTTGTGIRAGPAVTGLPTEPARLEAQLRWDGQHPFGDGALDAGESGTLLVDVTNLGARPTHQVRVAATSQQARHVVLPPLVVIPVIESGETRTARLELRAGAGLEDAEIRLLIEVREAFGHDAPPIEVRFPTRAAVRPDLVVMSDFAVSGAGLPVPRDTVVTVTLRVRNVGQGTARGVVARVTPGEGVFQGGEVQQAYVLENLAPGQIADLPYACYANRRADALELQVELLHAGDASASFRSVVTLPLEDSGAEPRVVRVRAEPRPTIALAPAPPPLTSDIDHGAMRSRTRRPQGLAVIFGVERYAFAPSAVHAADDARTAGRYFERVLGIPAERIQLLLDREVTLTQFHRVFGENGWLARRVDSETEVFVYFAGHGTAAEDASPFLMPADADLDYTRETGFSLDLLARRLAELGAADVTLFLDACFGGLTRRGEALLAGARPLVLTPARGNLNGITLFAATTGAQIANALDEQGHGLFTYYLFKGLGGAADLDGDRSIEAGELREFLEREVPEAAAAADHEQSPRIVLRSPDRVLAELH